MTEFDCLHCKVILISKIVNTASYILLLKQGKLCLTLLFDYFKIMIKNFYFI